MYFLLQGLHDSIHVSEPYRVAAPRRRWELWGGVEEVEVKEAEGYKLHLARSSTGYVGVSRRADGAMPYAAEFRTKPLGTFPTAVDAAVAYARHVAGTAAGTAAAPAGAYASTAASRAASPAAPAAPPTWTSSGSGSAPISATSPVARPPPVFA